VQLDRCTIGYGGRLKNILPPYGGLLQLLVWVNVDFLQDIPQTALSKK
jgi:uncharacterized protein Usg